MKNQLIIDDPTKPRKARILIYDLESFPNIAAVWGKYEQNVLWYEREGGLASFAYKWLGERQTHVKALPDYRTYRKDMYDDKFLIQDLYELFNQADAVVAHNGDSFDQKKANARYLAHNIVPPEPYKQIDTLKVARKHFKLNSNKLDDLGSLLGVGRKERTGGLDLWHDCYYGDTKAWRKMKSYNKQDVVLLEKVYLKLLPWMSSHPAMGILTNIPGACPKCGKGPMQKRGFNFTTVSTVQRYQCQSCGGWSQGRNIKRENVEYK